MAKTYGEILAEKNQRTAEVLKSISEGKLDVQPQLRFSPESTIARQNNTSRENLSLVGTRGPSSYSRR
jgi:hypothetical protein